MSFKFGFTAVATAVLALGATHAGAAAFEPLFTVTKVVGDVLVYKPGSEAPEKVVEDYAYPYGSRIVVSKPDTKTKPRKGVVIPEPEASISLSTDHMFRLGSGTDLTVEHGAGGDVGKKLITVSEGRVATFITITTVKTGGEIDAKVDEVHNALIIRTPLADCVRIVQRNEISVSKDGDNHSCVFSTSSGDMEVSLPQCKIYGIRRKSAFEVFGNKDFTRITRLAGEFTGEIERGSDPAEKVEFKGRSMAKIWRSYAEIGGKMAVAVMISLPGGGINSYAFLEGESAVIDSAITTSAGEQPPSGGAPVGTPLAGEGANGSAAPTPSLGEDIFGSGFDSGSATDSNAPATDNSTEVFEEFNFDNFSF